MAQQSIMVMGLTLTTLTPTKAATNRKQLMQNCQGSAEGVEKLSGVINNRVAAASRPTTAGRKPRKTDSTAWWCMYFMNILLMSIIRINEGNTKAKVAVAEPRMAIGIE